MYERLLGALLALAFSASAALAQAVVVPSSGRNDAGQVVFAPAPSINQAQTTITIPANGSKCIYVDSLVVGVGEDATGATGVQTFTTTNLGGLAYSFFPIVLATSPSAILFNQQLVGATPILSPTCGTAVTIVSPAQNAHLAYPMLAVAHYGVAPPGP